MNVPNHCAILLANDIVTSRRYRSDKKVLENVLQHLRIISDKAIEGNEGEVNTILLGQVIAFYNAIAPHLSGNGCEFSIVDELSKLVEKCYADHHNIDSCISTIAEHAPTACTLQVITQLEDTSFIEPSSLISALHTSLIRGAREGVRSELSGSLLRIQRAREEGHRPMINSGMVSWTRGSEEPDVDDEVGDFLWPSILEGTLVITK